MASNKFKIDLPDLRSLAFMWQNFTVESTPDTEQLENIKTHLDVLLIALESLTEISSEAILLAAKQLNLESIVADRVALWRLRQSNPKRKSTGGRKKLDIEEARSLVLIICYLARKRHQSIRHACELLARTSQQKQPLHHNPILGEYFDAFINIYQERMQMIDNITSESLYNLAQKLLIDLLFYSSPNGHRRLWLALLDYSE